VTTKATTLIASITSPDEVAWCTQRYQAIVANVVEFIRGKQQVVEMTAVCMVAQGHLLLDDVPGTGKTSLAKSLSNSIDASVRRIQFTPDLLPSDVSGVMIYDQGKHEFEFHAGPVFANILLADEINRASPKTQSALLEVMEEHQVTLDGRPYPVPEPFFVLATQNPIELSGTYELPEAQKDRFMMRMSIGYPDQSAEIEIVAERTKRQSPESLQPVVALADLTRMIDVASRVYLAPQIMGYIVALVAATRHAPELRLGASPRASVALATAAQAYAATHSRNFVTADDVKALAAVVLCHRMLLRPEAELQGDSAENVLNTILMSVPVPTDTRQRSSI
jgi:MoxR-like ATPase